jgi:general secretion pathway protein I
MRWGHPPQSDDRGFTLIEVLVALTILALSLTVLFSIFGHSLARHAESQSRMAARTIASSLLAQAEAAATLSPGESTGTVKPDLSWTLRVFPYGSRKDQESWPGTPVEISATVTWGDRGPGQTLTLSTLRLLPKAHAS